MDALRLIVDQPPPPRRRRVTHHGTRACVKEGCPESSFERKRSMPDGKDMAMNPVKPPGMDPAVDGRGAHPKLPKLPAADHPMLAFDEGTQGFCVELSPDAGSISTQKL